MCGINLPTFMLTISNLNIIDYAYAYAYAYAYYAYYYACDYYAGFAYYKY